MDIEKDIKKIEQESGESEESLQVPLQQNLQKEEESGSVYQGQEMMGDLGDNETEQLLRYQSRQLELGQFEFPTIEQMRKIPTTTSKKSLLSVLGMFIRHGGFKDMEIKYQGRMIDKVKNGKLITHLFIEYECCSGVHNKDPFLHYRSFDQQKFYLFGMRLVHDHSHLMLGHVSENGNPLVGRVSQKQKAKVLRMYEETFLFPQEGDLTLLSRFQGVESIKSAYERLAQQEKYSGHRIVFDFREVPSSYPESTSSRFNVYFNCCKEEHCAPYVSYVSKDGVVYTLSKNYRLDHVHSVQVQEQEEHEGPHLNEGMEKSFYQELGFTLENEILGDNIQEQNVSQEREGVRTRGENRTANQSTIDPEPQLEQSQQMDEEEYKQMQQDTIKIPLRRIRRKYVCEALTKYNTNQSNSKTKPISKKPRIRMTKQRQQEMLNMAQNQQMEQEQNSVENFSSNPNQLNDEQSLIRERAYSYRKMISMIEERKKENISIRQKIGKKQKRIFIFPTDDELQRIKPNSGKPNIRSAITYMALQHRKKGEKVNPHSTCPEEVDDYGRKVDVLRYEFLCCTGYNKRVPYLKFTQRQDQNFYTLEEYYQWHDHRPESQKNAQMEKTDKLITKNTSEKMNKTITEASESKPVSSPPRQTKKQKEEHSIIQEQQDESQHKVDQAAVQKKAIIENQQQNKAQLKKGLNLQEQPVNFSKKSQPIKEESIRNSQDIKIPSKEISQLEQKKQSQMDRNPQPVGVKKRQPNISAPSQEESLKANTQKQMKFKDRQEKMLAEQDEQIKENVPNIRQNQSEKMVPENNQAQIHKDKNGDVISQIPINQKESYKQSIQEWFDAYDAAVTKDILNTLLQDSLRNESSNKLNKSFLNYFKKWQKDSNENQIIWKECLYQVLKWNSYKILKLSNKTSQSKQKGLDFQNSIFVLKKDKQFNDLEIYLGVYPINLFSKEKKYNLLIAYTINYNLKPTILWFYISQPNIGSEVQVDFLNEEDHDQNRFYEVLKLTIKYLKIETAKFVYTNLDFHMMTALDMLCHEAESKNKFFYLMHFNCINPELFSKNLELKNEIKTRIRKSYNSTNVKSSLKFINSLRDEKNMNRESFNPRMIYKHYRNFIEPFSSKLKKNEPGIGMGFVSKQWFKKDERKYIKDPINELDFVLTRMNEFNDLSEIIIFVNRLFQLVPQKPEKVSVSLYSEVKCYPNENLQNKQYRYSLSSIFYEKAYQMRSVLLLQPRNIKYIFYRLVCAANELDLKQQGQSTDGIIYLYKESDNESVNYKVQFNNGDKRWSCSCQFYKQSGLPCQHQILTALKQKNSLYELINQDWKP